MPVSVRAHARELRAYAHARMRAGERAKDIKKRDRDCEEDDQWSTGEIAISTVLSSLRLL